MDGRVALVKSHGVAPVHSLHLAEPVGHLVERLVPADRLPAAVVGTPEAAQRRTQPVRVLVDVLESVGLGAEVSPTEGIVAITPDRRDVSVFVVVDLEATHRLAEVANSVVLRHARQATGTPRPSW